MKHSFYFAVKAIMIALFIFIFSERSAHAYIDPGTGSLILQAVLAAIAGSAVAIKIFWRRIKSFYLHLFGKETPRNTTQTEDK